jgi:glycosyltransferase involved in cell wall biosynthesis
VIPGKNAAPFIGDALFSLTRQFDDARVMEVIFVDDGSTDGGADIVARHRDHLPGLVIVRNETAGGVSRARNQGIAIARGRYLSFLDADDWFAPGHLASLVRDIERLGCDFLRTDVIKSRGSKRELKRAPQGRRGVCLDPRSSILPYDRLTMVDHTWAQAGLYDRRLLDAGLLEFSEGLRTAEDRLWAWRLHLQADSYAVVDAPGFVYRMGTPDSLTQTLDDKLLDYLLAFDSVRVLIDQNRERERFMPKVIQTVFAMTDHHMDSLDRMPPELQKELPARARELLMRFDAAEVDGVVRMLSPERRARLHLILPERPASGWQ